MTPIGQSSTAAVVARDDVTALLRCPACRGSLTQPGLAQGDPTLRCGDCRRGYPVVRGLPRLLVGGGAGSDVSRSFGFQWRARRQGFFERNTLYGLSSEAERRGFFEGLGISPEAVTGKRILDAGCGDGFLLTLLAEQPTRIVGMDLSASAQVAAERCQGFANVTVLQADLFAPPFAPASFDYVWCEGVLVHTEDPRQGFRILADLVKPGGRLFIWMYSAERLTIYQRIRDLLRIAHRLPHPLLLFLSYLLAIPVTVAKRLRGGAGTPERFGAIAFALFDNLSPRVQSRHTAAELREWFVAGGFSELKQTGFIGMSGTKLP